MIQMNNVRKQRRDKAAMMTSDSHDWTLLLTEETRERFFEMRDRKAQKNLRKSEFTRAQSSPQTLEGS